MVDGKEATFRAQVGSRRDTAQSPCAPSCQGKTSGKEGSTEAKEKEDSTRAGSVLLSSGPLVSRVSLHLLPRDKAHLCPAHLPLCTSYRSKDDSEALLSPGTPAAGHCSQAISAAIKCRERKAFARVEKRPEASGCGPPRRATLARID